MGEENAYKGRPLSTVSVPVARALRKRLTPQEAKLWNKLRALRPAGYHFRRQVPIASYVVDFACLKHALVVEVDGGQHAEVEHLARDQARDEHLLRLGFRPLRFWNADVDQNLEGVIETILDGLSNGAFPPLRGG